MSHYIELGLETNHERKHMASLLTLSAIYHKGTRGYTNFYRGEANLDRSNKEM